MQPWMRDQTAFKRPEGRPVPERPSSACSSSTLRGDLRTSAPGAYLPAVSASGTCAYRRAARAARRPDLMDKPSLQMISSNKPGAWGTATLRRWLCPLFELSTGAGWMHRRSRQLRRQGAGCDGLPRLLCARRERPRRRAAEQRDEVAAPDPSCHLIPPAEGPPEDTTLIGPCPASHPAPQAHN